MKDGGESSCKFARFKESNETINPHVESLDYNYSMRDWSQHWEAHLANNVLAEQVRNRVYTETYNKLVLCWGLHQVLDKRMLRENGEGDTLFRDIAQLSEYMHQVLKARKDESLRRGDNLHFNNKAIDYA